MTLSRLRPLLLALVLSGLPGLGPGCADHTDEEIRARVTLAASHEGSEAASAVAALVRYGPRALPTIESALHTAPPVGRKNLLLAIRQIGDVVAVPLLRHLALHDRQPEIQRDAEVTLRMWAAGEGAGSTPARAERARAAVRELDEARGREEAG